MRWVAYQTAYLKTHYPVEFMAALLTSETSKPDNVVKYIGECREMGIAVEPPDVQVSGAQFTSARRGHSLRPGRGEERGRQCHRIHHQGARRGGRPLQELWEFCEKVDLRVMNKRVIESLIKAGALDSLGTRGQLIAAVDKAMERAQKAQKDAAAGPDAACSACSTRRRTRPQRRRPAACSPTGKRASASPTRKRCSASLSPAIRWITTLRNCATCTGVISVAEALERKPPERRWGGQSDPADEIQVAGIMHGSARAEEHAAIRSSTRRPRSKMLPARST